MNELYYGSVTYTWKCYERYHSLGFTSAGTKLNT